MKNKIICNQEILEVFWSHNMPYEIESLMSGVLAHGLPIEKSICSGLIITKDINTDKTKLFFGTTNFKDGEENIELIIKGGCKLEGSGLQGLIKFIQHYIEKENEKK
jgi:hypothetical protein